jgi:guanosine-3',5'-bis(diphosphate) 3'-pyrophosphohydrolase
MNSKPGPRTNDMPSEDTLALLFSVLDFAALKHRKQRRKDEEQSPYINHPIAVGRLLVCEIGERDAVIIAAALLHDTVEDTDTKFAELQQHFGSEVADIVRELTDDKLLAKEERKRLQIKNAAHASPQAKAVKLADKICNLRDINACPPAGWSLERKREYFDWAKKVVDRLRGEHPQLEKLFDAEFTRRP